MGQKVRPTGFRTGIMLDWQSSWYASKQDFAELLVEDQRIRAFIQRRYGRSGISRIRIERTREKVVVFIYSARVGMIIGKKGQEVDKLTQDLEGLTHRHIEVKTMEINRPEVDPKLVSEGAKGIRVQLSGRLGGSEMARQETNMAGNLPLSTLRAKIEYGFSEAKTAQGNIGIKVWINNGDYLDSEETGDAAHAQAGKVSKKPTRQGKR
jgi:small subunit ribosomal protein S3